MNSKTLDFIDPNKRDFQNAFEPLKAMVFEFKKWRSFGSIKANVLNRFFDKWQGNEFKNIGFHRSK